MGYLTTGGRNVLDPGGIKLDLGSKVRGGYGEFLTSENRSPVIASTDFVYSHCHAVNDATAPRVWGRNQVIVKDIASAQSYNFDSQVFGDEISVSNNTTEANKPQTNGQLVGLFLSYINSMHKASAALSIGGLTAGWNNGIWIDGIDKNGTAIKLVDDVGQSVGSGANSGMAAGLDTTEVSGFTQGAVLLGNAHKVRGKTTNDAIRDLVHINSSNEVVLGDRANPTPVRIAGNALKLDTPVGVSATAGTRGVPPNQVAGYLIADLPTGRIKIPYYNA